MTTTETRPWEGVKRLGGERWAVVLIGCAECGDTPLGAPGGTFTSEADAKTLTERRLRIEGCVWRPHPQGGSIWQTRSGAVWVFPISTLNRSAEMPS